MVSYRSRPPCRVLREPRVFASPAAPRHRRRTRARRPAPQVRPPRRGPSPSLDREDRARSPIDMSDAYPASCASASVSACGRGAGDVGHGRDHVPRCGHPAPIRRPGFVVSLEGPFLELVGAPSAACGITNSPNRCASPAPTSAATASDVPPGSSTSRPSSSIVYGKGSRISRYRTVLSRPSMRSPSVCPSLLAIVFIWVPLGAEDAGSEHDGPSP